MSGENHGVAPGLGVRVGVGVGVAGGCVGAGGGTGAATTIEIDVPSGTLAPPPGCTAMTVPVGSALACRVITGLKPADATASPADCSRAPTISGTEFDPLATVNATIPPRSSDAPTAGSLPSTVPPGRTESAARTSPTDRPAFTSA